MDFNIRKPDPALIKIAQDFFTKFGFTDELDIDDFDMFIIDKGMAEDPETSDTNDARFMKFITERTTARNKLNRAGAWVKENRFSVEIVKPGKEYAVKPWHEASIDHAADIGKRVQKFAENKGKSLEDDLKVIKFLASEKPKSRDLKEAKAMLEFLKEENEYLQGRIVAYITQSQLAEDAVHERVLRLQQLHDYTALTSPNEETEDGS